VTKGIKLKFYPAMIGVFLGLGLFALILSRFDIQVSLESAPPSEVNPPPSRIPVNVPPVPSAVPSPTAPSTPAAVTPPPPEVLDGTEQGGLRISNQTGHPIRVALLHRSESSNPSAQDSSSNSPAFTSPVHWDFAPGEGQRQGLSVSFPDRPLRLLPGDVLVGFAQDGSRRYWGPYVIGQTLLPRWDSQAKEWQLELR
jgi:hypothetical protein